MFRRLPDVLAAAVLIAGGCSMFQHGKSGYEPVSDADYGRLAPGQTGPVDAARQARAEANDAVARSKLDVQRAQHELDLAQAEQTAARADVEKAKAEQDAAANSNDPGAKARSEEQAAAAELRTRSAQARLAYAQRLVDERKAQVDAATEQVKVRDAELERAKLTALSQAQIPAATKYDPAPFDAHVADTEQAYQQARADASAKSHQTEQARKAWSTLDQQYQARVNGQGAPGAAATGTGSAAAPPPAPPPAPAPSAGR